MRGAAFLGAADSTSRGEIRHLHIVITEPDEGNEVLVVPVCTFREKDGVPFPGQDRSCILPAGCHPFIKEKSYARYRNAKAMRFADIFNGISKGSLASKENLDLYYVQNMQRGAEESPFIPDELKCYFEHFTA
jgi:hypothetical protein